MDFFIAKLQIANYLKIWENIFFAMIHCHGNNAITEFYHAPQVHMYSYSPFQGQIQDFKLGGWEHTYKNSAEQREARKFLGYFVSKITISRFYSKKSYFFQF
jgi:hypothetical protein